MTDAAPKAAAPPLETIYTSDTLSAYLNPGSDDPAARPAFVTFEGIGLAVRKRTGEYFGAPLARKLGLDIIHVVPRDTEWYHYHDMDDCLATIRERISPETIAYGSSMGAYAVAHFADRLGVLRGLCFSPQISIQQSVVPFEKRWQTEASRTEFPHDDTIAPRQARLWIFTDMEFAEERAHAEMIAASGPTEIVPVPNAGHPVGQSLLEAGLLGQIIATFLEGRESREVFDEMLGAGLPEIPSVLIQKASSLRGRDRERLLREALILDPTNRKARMQLGVAFLKNGKIEKGERVLRPLFEKPNAKLEATYLRVCERHGITPVLLKKG